MTSAAADRAIEVIESADGRHLHARVGFDAGSLVVPFGVAKLLSGPDRYSYQTGVSTHVLPDPDGLRFLNHSCAPNVFVNPTTMRVEALHRIEPGDELVFFYPSTEWLMSEPFSCRCNVPWCLGRIEGAARVDPGILSRYALADHIKTLLERQNGGGADAAAAGCATLTRGR